MTALALLVLLAQPAFASTPAFVLPANARTITYSAAFEGSAVRPIVGEYLQGTMQLKLYPSGILQGWYIPQEGSAFGVTGGVDANGKVWLQLPGAIVTGEWGPGDTIVAYSTGPSFDNLKFDATPLKH
jgi:hypothetical protein